MNNNEAITAVRNSVITIAKDVKRILGRVLFGYCPEAAPSAGASTAQPTPVEQPTTVVEASAIQAEVVAPEPVEPATPKEALPNLKVCSRCKVKKPLDIEHFHRDSHKISGFRSACRDCSNTTLKQVSCNGCGVSKPLTAQFWQRNAKAKSGFRNPCKECLKKPKTA